MTNTKQAVAAGDISREAAAELIYREAMLLDQHQWEEWLSLYSADAVFWMPSWGSESELITDPELELNLIYFKNRDGLEDRVFRIESGDSFATVPMDRTAHVVRKRAVIAGLPGPVRGGVVQAEQEGVSVVAGSLLNIGHGALCEQVGEVAIVVQAVLAFPQIVVAAAVDVGEIIQAARHGAYEVLVARLQWTEMRQVTQMPLAHQGGAITRPPQQ
jgi:hypothetical protein